MAASETRSFKRAAIVVRDVGDQSIAAKTIERVVYDVGHELAQRRDADPRSDESLARLPEEPPSTDLR